MCPCFSWCTPRKGMAVGGSAGRIWYRVTRAPGDCLPQCSLPHFTPAARQPPSRSANPMSEEQNLFHFIIPSSLVRQRHFSIIYCPLSFTHEFPYHIFCLFSCWIDCLFLNKDFFGYILHILLICYLSKLLFFIGAIFYRWVLKFI